MKIKMKNRFIKGMGSAFDIFGTTYLSGTSVRGYKDILGYDPLNDEEVARQDYEAIKSDWEAVGNDMRQAMDVFAEKIMKKNRSKKMLEKVNKLSKEAKKVLIKREAEIKNTIEYELKNIGDIRYWVRKSLYPKKKYLSEQDEFVIEKVKEELTDFFDNFFQYFFDLISKNNKND